MCCSFSIETQHATFPVRVALVLFYAMLRRFPKIVIVHVVLVCMFAFIFILCLDELEMNMSNVHFC